MLEIQTILQKNLQTAIAISNKWKSDINSGPKWKPIKCCKIVCDYNITPLKK